MSVHYIETYEIDGHRYGIEDQGDGRPAEEHFFHYKYRFGARLRFTVWCGGRSVGERETLTEARTLVHVYAFRAAVKELDANLARAEATQLVVTALRGDDIFKLAKFLVD